MQSALEFKQLCRDAGRILGLADADRFADNGRLSVGEVPMAVFLECDDDDLLGPMSVDCYVDLGPVNGAGRELALECLLALNLAIPRKREGVVGFDQDSRHAILCIEIEEGSLDSAEGFAQFFTELADFARELKRRFLSSDATTSDPVPHYFHIA